MQLQAIYADGHVWQGETALPRQRLYELSAALGSLERNCLIYRAVGSNGEPMIEWVRTTKGWLQVKFPSPPGAVGTSSA